jgi:N-acetylglutamate synthase/N-acetylornithine aminotransferase
MVQDEFEIVVDLEMGEAEAKYWTCDFSYVSVSLRLPTERAGAMVNKGSVADACCLQEYVSINGDYRS